MRQISPILLLIEVYSRSIKLDFFSSTSSWAELCVMFDIWPSIKIDCILYTLCSLWILTIFVLCGVLMLEFWSPISDPCGGLCALPLSTAQICHGTLVRRALYISLDWLSYVEHAILWGDIQRMWLSCDKWYFAERICIPLVFQTHKKHYTERHLPVLVAVLLIFGAYFVQIPAWRRLKWRCGSSNWRQNSG